MDEDGGMCVPHAASVISGVSFRRESDEKPTDGPILEEVGLDTEIKRIRNKKSWKIIKSTGYPELAETCRLQ